MTDDPSPTLRRRELGAHLRRLRTERGWTTKEVADRLGFSLSKVSRMETGARGVNTRDMAALKQLFGVDEEFAAYLDHIARTGKRRTGIIRPASLETDYVKIEQSGFLDLEWDADAIREYNSGVIPGLLQTARYMEASMLGAVPDVDASVLRSAINTRQRRQRRLKDRAETNYEVVLDEAALWREVGGREVMAEQLDHLADAVRSDQVSLGIIPFSAGAHPGVNSDFVFLGLSDPGVPDAVFVEGLAGHWRFDRPDEVNRYGRVWEHLWSIAFTGVDAIRLVCRARDGIGPTEDRQTATDGVAESDTSPEG